MAQLVYRWICAHVTRRYNYVLLWQMSWITVESSSWLEQAAAQLHLANLEKAVRNAVRRVCAIR